MTTQNATTMDFSPRAIAAALAAAGDRLDGLSAIAGEGWLTLRTGLDGASGLLTQLGAPGLWKPIARPEGGGLMCEFHLPVSALAGADVWAGDGEDGDDPVQACLAWAAATAGGELPAGWKSPPRQEVDAWLPPRGLVVQSGPHVRQGSLVCAPDRLALSFPVVHRVPQNLSPPRRDWIEQVLADAQNRWRMVRVGFEGPGDEPAIRAEVDFSGAPGVVLEGLFRAGFDAIRFVVSWLLWPIAFLCDPRVSCRSWEGASAGAPRKKED